MQIKIYAFCAIFCLSGYSQTLWSWVVKDFQVLMRTHGEVSFAPYVQGEFEKFEVNPGYRSNFHAYVDFFEWKGFISNWLIANTTIIENNPETGLTLDKIKYTLTPGYRIEFKEHLISGLLLHECIHTISKPEKEGAVWWNSFQIGFGSNGAYPRFLLDTYRRGSKQRFPDFDYSFNVGAFLYGDQSKWIQQNHDYRYEYFHKMRLHLGKIKSWGFYSDYDHHTWRNSREQFQNKMSIDFNILLNGIENLASVFYKYTFYDTFSKDNQDGLGAMGFKIVF